MPWATVLAIFLAQTFRCLNGPPRWEKLNARLSASLTTDLRFTLYGFLGGCIRPFRAVATTLLKGVLLCLTILTVLISRTGSSLSP